MCVCMLPLNMVAMPLLLSVVYFPCQSFPIFFQTCQLLPSFAININFVGYVLEKRNYHHQKQQQHR